MPLIMSGLDFHTAPLDLRQRLAYSKEAQLALLERLRIQTPCVLLSTCNRTELYVTADTETPWRLLCPDAALEPYFTTRTGPDAVRHLMEVACGLHSQILGEDQIVTQVRTAMDLARQAGSADAQLSALFRLAVTAGKRAKTEVHVAHDAPSLGSRCVEQLKQSLGSLENQHILVIGNGQMGRLAAVLLREAGAQVQVTLRSYRHGETVVPAGCTAVPYENRLEAIAAADAVISATASPHYTLTKEQLNAAAALPKVLVDLAVPREIDPACSQLVPCYDVDSLGQSGPGSETELAQLQAIAAEGAAQFLQWQQRQTVRPLRFPLFLDLTGKRVVVVGGGAIASRRIGVLRQFGCEIAVVSPDLQARPDGLVWQQRCYRPGDLEGAFLAVAATHDRTVNQQVGEDARALGIPVSVADCEAECTFYFPAICTGDNLIAGLVSTGKDHHRTSRAAKEIRRVLEELE